MKKLLEKANDWATISAEVSFWFVLVLGLYVVGSFMLPLPGSENFLFLTRPMDLIIVLYLLAIFVYQQYGRNGDKFLSITQTRQSQSLDARLSKLVQALEDAGAAIGSIEDEIEARKSLVTELESQKKIAEQAIELSQEQVDAVAAILSEQVATQSKKDFRQELLKDLLIFLAGVVLTLLIGA